MKDLAPAPYNPRKIDAEDLVNLHASMREFGDLSGIVKNIGTGHLVGGHQRVKAFDPAWPIRKEKASDSVGTVAVGHIETPYGRWSYREVDWPEEKEKAANVTANKIRSDFDRSALAEVLVDLDTANFDIALTGFSLEEVQKIIGGEPEVPGDADHVPALKSKAVTKHGDVWELGEHRLMCGDSTREDDVRTLTGSQAADLVFTDPPYGVNYRSRSERKEFDPVKGDSRQADELITKILLPAFRNAVKFTSPSAAFYIWHASSTREEFAHAMKAAGLVERQYIIWAKNNFVMGHADYHWAHEPCFYAAKDGQRPDFYGDRTQQTVWTAVAARSSSCPEDQVVTTLAGGLLLVDGRGGQVVLMPRAPKGKKIRKVRLEPGQTVAIGHESAQSTLWLVGKDASIEHPTQKLVELAVRAIENSSRPGQAVLDLFVGSGCTLIAAEVTGRKCFAMEMDPLYCDQIVERWEKFTGKKAHKEAARERTAAAA